MNLLRIWGTRKFFTIAALYYLLFFGLFFFTQKRSVPDFSLVLMQMLGMGMIVFFSLLYDKLSISKTLLIIAMFQLICCYGLRGFNMDYFNDPFGYSPIDALIYHRYGSHIELSIIGYIKYLNVLEVRTDDMGFSLIVYFVYHLAGDPLRGIQLLVFFNAVSVIISSFYVYKTSNLFFEKGASCFIAFFWGTELYAVYTATAGLKENFMVLFIVIAIYYIIRVNRGMFIRDIICAILFSLPILLFRTSVFYMLISVLLFVLILRFPVVKRYFYVYIIMTMLLASFYAYQIIDELAMQQGLSYDFIEGLVESKVRNQGKMPYILNYLASVVGPLPNMVSADIVKRNYITLYSFSSMCKVFYSFYFLYAIYGIFKNKNFELIGLFIFWLLNTVMLDFTLFAQHDRYQWPHIPCTIILAIYGLKCWNENHHKLKWDLWYIAMAFGFIIIFNFR